MAKFQKSTDTEESSEGKSNWEEMDLENIGSKTLEIEIEDDPIVTKETVKKDKTIEEEDEEENIDTGDVVEEEDDETEDKIKPQSRSQKRIIGLVTQSKEKDQLIAKLQQERQEIEQRFLQSRTQDIELKSTATKEKIDSLSKELVRAKTEGNVEVEVEVLNKLQRANVELMSLDALKTQPVTKSTTTETQQGPTREQVIGSLPSVGQKWANKQSWFMTNERLTKDAIGISNELEAEGYTVSEPEYYQQLEARMAELYPSRFVKKSIKSNNVDMEEQTQKETQKKPQVKSPVAQGSRTTPTQKAGTIRLTKEDVAQAKRMNVPLQVYANSKRQSEESEARGEKEVTLFE